MGPPSLTSALPSASPATPSLPLGRSGSQPHPPHVPSTSFAAQNVTRAPGCGQHRTPWLWPAVDVPAEAPGQRAKRLRVTSGHWNGRPGARLSPWGSARPPPPGIARVPLPLHRAGQGSGRPAHPGGVLVLWSSFCRPVLLRDALPDEAAKPGVPKLCVRGARRLPSQGDRRCASGEHQSKWPGQLERPAAPRPQSTHSHHQGAWREAPGDSAVS